MRRFEFVEGTSSKFWEIDRSGSTLTIRFGRIGANGQTQLKGLDTEEKAQKELDRLVAEKAKKGYVEVGAGASSAPPATAPSPAPAAPIPAAGTGALPAAEEEDGIHWTEALRKRVYPRRGGVEVRVAALPPAAKSWAVVQEAWAKRAERISRTIARKVPGHEILASLKARVEASAPSAGSLDEDSVLVCLLAFAPTYSTEPVYDASLEALAAAGGLPHAVGAALVALERSVDVLEPDALVLQERPSTHWSASFHQHGRLLGLPRLRALLAVAPEADYLRARDAAAALRESGSAAQRAAASFLFPTEAGWVAADAAAYKAGQGFVCALASLSDPALLVGASAQGKLFVGRWNHDPQDVATTLLDGCGTGAAAFLISDKLGYGDADMVRARFGTLAVMGCDEAMGELIASIEQREALAALADASARQPRRALRLLSAAATQRSKAGEAAKGLLATTARRFPRLAAGVLPALGPEAAKVLQELAAEAADAPEDARLDELPLALRAPPWTRPQKPAAPVVARPAPVEVAPAMRWAPGEREEWLARRGWSESHADCDRLVANHQEAFVADLFVCPERLAAQLAPLTTRVNWRDEDWFFPIAAKHGLEALAFFKLRLAGDALAVLPALVPFGVSEFAPRVADALASKRSARAPARAWLLRHPEHAAAGLLEAALGKPGKARRCAEAALRLIAQGGHEAAVLEVAQRAGVRDAVATALCADPLDLLPAKMPALPAFADAGALPRPLLRARRAALPRAASEALLTMLAISPLDEPYAGLAQVKEACTPASLARFAWDLFQAWLVNGAPPKEGWCLNALGHLGDDDCARRLAKRVRDWPGEAAHARAVAGLDVLAAIGTDVALMHLNGLALKVKFKGLQGKAVEKIEAIAAVRGLSREELEDRLAPDLGLDEDGSLALDFGARTFRVGFDEQLRPFVRDAEGSRLKDLPKPKQADDAERATAAAARWGQLKKDAKTSAGLQILRLELAMCGQRRFAAESFLALFVRHPLVFHVVRRLVWATYDDAGKLQRTFRVAEDRTLADAEDAAFALPEGAQVGIPHPLELEAATLGRWSQRFADYEIFQPFPQLGRPTYAPTPQERAAPGLDRVKGLKLPTGKVLGLEQRRWRRGPPEDGGVVGWMEKPLPGGLVAALGLDPGLYTGMLSESPEQTLGEVKVGAEGGRWRRDPGTPGTLDPIVFSELVADLERLRS